MFSRFLDLLFPPRKDEEALRSISRDDFLHLLAPKLIKRTDPATVTLLSYRNAQVRAAIHEAKYRGTEKAFSYLGAAFAEYLRDSDEDLRNAVIVPIPLGRQRRIERGFNQAEEIAKRACKELNIPLETAVLARVRETASQVSIVRWKRAENMQDAFSVSGEVSADTLYIVLDDVTTTGATLKAAIAVLKKAGAVRILPVALAH